MKVNTINSIRVIVVLMIGVFLGWLIFGGNSSHESHGENTNTNQAEHTTWTCSMHPHIRQSEAGDCPICGMELIPIEQEGTAGNSEMVMMSDYAQKLANVQTLVVGDNSETGQIQLNGKIAVDERRTYVQSSHIPGRIEQLMVNFTGENVNRGQALARIYSPELMTAQKELLEAYAIRESNPKLFEAAKERLKRWKVSERQINNILETQQASDQFTIYADVNGIVKDKLVDLGDYIERGEAIYEVANLEKLWVQFDAYERTMGWIEKGSKVSFFVNSLPGETFEGVVSFIDPLLNNQTRVSAVRVEIDNKEGRLKPGMFVTGTIEAAISSNQKQLSVPKSAVLWTGERSIVYVKDNGGFLLRNVVLGPDLGGSYVIKEGLESGEEIVVNGTFTVDAAAQLAGKTSMMNPKEDVSSGGHVHEQAMLPKIDQAFEISKENQDELKQVLSAYLLVKDALVEDNFSQAKTYTTNLWAAVGKVDSEQMDSQAQHAWKAIASHLHEIEKMTKASDIEGLRSHFEKVSELMIYTFSSYVVPMETLYVQHCPMANSDLGANWLSRSEQVKNPYFGSQMLFCGEVVKEIN